MNTCKIYFKSLSKKAKIPTRGSDGAAGRDLYVCFQDNTTSILIPPHETVSIPLGFATSMPKGMGGLVFIRSGAAKNRGLRLSNGVAVIDSDFRGEWSILIHNDSNTYQQINDGERIAQVVFIAYGDVEFNEVDVLDETDRGEGGFGSTGTK